MISIFTPSYNRAYRLPALYHSLLRQTSYDFEWIIVDDGSVDNTQKLVCSWIEQATPFPIYYHYQKNGGKHTAINTGVSMAQSDWFCIVDSDDYLTDDAVELVHKWIATVDSDEIAAVSGIKCFPETGIIGQCSLEKSAYIDAKNNERRKFHLLGDKAEVYRTDILKRYPFPVFPGETFLAESAVWDAIAVSGYKIRWFSCPIMVCEYLEDGLSEQLRNSDIEVKNFEGCTYCTQVMLKAYRGLEKIRILCQYLNKGRRKGLTVSDIADRIQVPCWQLWLLMVPVWLKKMTQKMIFRNQGNSN